MAWWSGRRAAAQPSPDAPEDSPEEPEEEPQGDAAPAIPGESPLVDDGRRFSTGICTVCDWRGPARRARLVAWEDAMKHRATHDENSSA